MVGLLIIATVIIIVLMLKYYMQQRDIKKLNNFLEKILAGSTELEVLNQTEGELGILRANIYKTTTALISQRAILQKDKVLLADALADISHQFKTPLTSLMVMNDLLEDETDEDKRREFLATQSVQLDRINWLIQTLLKTSKLDAGLLTFTKKSISDESLIKSVLNPFIVNMELKNISLIKNLLGLELNCDEAWTREAIQNIVKNCIEHMDENGTLEISDRDTNLYHEIIIKDDGVGIAEEDLPHIFERFYRGKNSGTDSVGIGLALSKAIIENQNGVIEVDSEEGVGTTFNIKLYKTVI